MTTDSNPRIDILAHDTASRVAKRMYSAAHELERSTLPAGVRELVEVRASQINGCGFCLDMHTKEAVAAGESHERLHLVAVWRETTVFTAAERAALALTEEGTRLADSHGVSEETWAAAGEHFDDDQLADLACVIAFINAANRLNVIARNPGGDYRVGMLAGAF